MPSLLERAQAEGTPLVDEETVTFVWQGERPPILIGDFNGWNNEQPAVLTEAEPGVWTHQMNVPRDAYLEYAYILDPDIADTDAGRSPDPFNRRTKWNGIKATNYYFYMPEARPTPLVRRGRGVAKGILTRHVLATEEMAATSRREVYLYRPAADGPLPLLVVLDGVDYLKQAKITVMVDNLIAQGRIRPVAMALVQNGRQARMVEYGCSDLTVSFLCDKVLPLARQELDLIDMEQSPGVYGILGASMGGVMSLYTAYRVPHIFGKVLSQAGAFSLENDLVIYDLVRHGEKRPLKIWLNCGTYDFLYETNQRMRVLLGEKGYDFTYHQSNTAHNYYAWRDDLPAGLEYIFGRP
jgi:enterochelin esterase-like enzyme